MTLNIHASSSRTEERRQTFSWNSTGGENLSNPSIEKDSGLQKARKNSGTTMREKCPRHGCVRSSRVNSGERMILETLPQEDLKENIGDVCFILPTNSQRRVAPPVSIPCTVFKCVYTPLIFISSPLFRATVSFLVYRPRHRVIERHRDCRFVFIFFTIFVMKYLFLNYMIT